MSEGARVATDRATYEGAGVSIEAGDRAVSADEGLGRPGAPPRDDRRDRRLRRPLRRQRPQGLRPAPARDLRRRRRHQGRHRPGPRQARHDRVRPGRHARRRPRRLRRRAAVPHRLHRHRAGRTRADRAIVKGIAEACVAAGCGLIGGETAEHPGLLDPDEYDVAGSTTGVVEANQLLGPGRVRPGDVVVAMASSGLHSNGYSLVRHVLLEQGKRRLDEHVDDLGRTLGEELLEPTRIYAKACLDLARDTETHAMSHITGGGLAANLERVLPVELTVNLDRTTWSLPPVFRLVAETGAWRGRTSSRPSTAGWAWSRSPRRRTPTGGLPACRRRHPRLGRGEVEPAGTTNRGRVRLTATTPEPVRARPTTLDRVTTRRPPDSGCPSAGRDAGITTGLSVRARTVNSDRLPVAVNRPNVRGGRPYGARPCKGEADQGRPRAEVPDYDTDFASLAKELHGDESTCRRVDRVAATTATSSMVRLPRHPSHDDLTGQIRRLSAARCSQGSQIPRSPRRRPSAARRVRSAASFGVTPSAPAGRIPRGRCRRCGCPLPGPVELEPVAARRPPGSAHLR